MAKPVQNIQHDGKMQRPPRVLIVDDNGAQLNMFAQRARGNKSGLFYGVEPVFIAYGYQPMPLEEGVKQLNTLDDIVAFANDPANGIDAVICDLYDAPEEISPEQLGLDPDRQPGRRRALHVAERQRYRQRRRPDREAAGCIGHHGEDRRRSSDDRQTRRWTGNNGEARRRAGAAGAEHAVNAADA